MLTVIEGVLGTDVVRQFRDHLEAAKWHDGARTAGGLAGQVKHNLQLPEDTEPALSLGHHVLRALAACPRFEAAALPLRIYPPRFNRYRPGHAYGPHVDSALMPVPGAPVTVRTDLSATLFLSDPADYDGGELSIRDGDAWRRVKLPAGDLALYPADRVHHVAPVTRGQRFASFFWIQSTVRSAHRRALLAELDASVQALTEALGARHPEVVRLSGLYHNLLREWGGT